MTHRTIHTERTARAARPLGKQLRIRRRIHLFAGLLAGLAGLSFGLDAAAQAFPTRKPITIVVPQTAGGSSDAIARLLAEKLSEDLKQTVLVENRPGASGMIGAASVARAEPDGYTLYLNASIHSINSLLYKSTIKFDSVKDFAPIGLIATAAVVFAISPSEQAQTVQQFVAAVKASPKKYSFAITGYGAAGHLATVQFIDEAGIPKGDLPFALYKGAAPALQDVIGGQVAAIMDPAALPHARSGRLRALAVTGRERSPLLPNVPTMRESGFKDFEFYSWYGLWAPAKVPAPVMDVLEAAVGRAVQTPAFKARLGTLGLDVDYRNAANFTRFIATETAKYQALIDKAEIKVDQ